MQLGRDPRDWEGTRATRQCGHGFFMQQFLVGSEFVTQQFLLEFLLVGVT